MTSRIHETAIVDRSADLGEGVVVGAYAVVGAGVRIGDDTEIGAHATVLGDTVLGRANRVFPYAAIGFDPQDLKYEGESSRLVIGDRNQFREFSTVNRGHGLRRRRHSHRRRQPVHGPEPRRPRQSGSAAEPCSRTAAPWLGTWRSRTMPRSAPSRPSTSSVAWAGMPTSAATPVITMDALPFCITVGIKPACMGVNRIGLERKGKSAEEHPLDRAGGAGAHSFAEEHDPGPRGARRRARRPRRCRCPGRLHQEFRPWLHPLGASGFPRRPLVKDRSSP